jgi:hypothetical protein
MKSFVKKLLGILFILLLSSCGRGFYYSNDTVGTEVLTIDQDTKIFARKLYAKENRYNGRELSYINDDTINGKGMLTEVQYLIFNKNKVLYVSTVASRYIYDKTDSYLIQNSSGKNFYPNSFYFNSFYFGKYDENEGVFRFKNGKTAQDWKINIGTDNDIELVYINNYNLKKERFNGADSIHKNLLSTEVVNQSVGNMVKFKKMNYFKFLSFKIPNERKDYAKTGVLLTTKARTYTKANKICMVFKEGENQKLKYLFIPFSDELIPGFKALKFSSKRVRYY